MVSLPVPPVGHEEHDWEAQSDGMTGRRRLAAASGPYRSTLPAALAQYQPAVPAGLAADVDEATVALARFDDHARSRLGSESPTLGPMSSILLRTESASSSQIENLTVGARQLALADLDQSTSDNARTVIGNVRAMEAALQLSDRLDHDAILTMQHVLISAHRGSAAQTGRYRDSLVWVGSSAVSPIGASHIAPQAEHVPGAMNDLIAFMRRSDVPALLQAALAHAQFETIHPFTDGNGRTGRAVVHALLRAKRVVSNTTVPLSAGLLKQTPQYFDALTAYQQGEAAPIAERFVEAALFASASGSRLVDDVYAETETARDKLTGLRKNASAWSVIPHLVAHPVLDARFLMRHLGLNEVTAQRALAQLLERGVLEERSGFKRNRVYQHSGILRVLDAYAQQLHRQ